LLRPPVVLFPECARGGIAFAAGEAIVDCCQGTVPQAAFLFEASFGLFAQWRHDAPNPMT
jgi:hypothetical protein